MGFNVSYLEVRNSAEVLSVTVQEMNRTNVYPYVS